jgi:hypothetical protein
MPNKDSDLCPTERIAIVTAALAVGRRLSTADVAALVGISRCGAWEMLNKLSRVLPIMQIRGDDGRLVWHRCDDSVVCDPHFHL